MHKILFLIIFSLIFVPTVFAQNSATSSTNTTICKFLFDLDPYNQGNIYEIQKYIRGFYPKFQITQKYDIQTINYLKKIQAKFGLKQTGKIDQETLNYFKNLNNCYKAEEIFKKYSSSTVQTNKNKIYKDPAESFWLMYNLIRDYVNVYGTSNMIASSSSSTIYNTQIQVYATTTNSR